MPCCQPWPEQLWSNYQLEQISRRNSESWSCQKWCGKNKKNFCSKSTCSCALVKLWLFGRTEVHKCEFLQLSNWAVTNMVKFLTRTGTITQMLAAFRQAASFLFSFTFPPGVTLPTWTACTTKAPTLQRQTTALCGTLGMGGGILWNPLSWRSDQQTLNLILFKYFIKTFYLVNLSANQSRLKQMGRFIASHLCIYKFGIIPLQPVVLWDANEKTIWPMYL